MFELLEQRMFGRQAGKDFHHIVRDGETHRVQKLEEVRCLQYFEDIFAFDDFRF